MQIINPENKQEWLKLRTADITSTDVAALFGISPYATKFELWHRKQRGDIVEFTENKRMKWGTALESSIAQQIAKDQGWSVRRMTDYIRDENIRAGASFDFAIGEDGLLEIKNVDGLIFRDQWIEDENGNLQAPPHIEIQVQHQLLVSERKYAYIGALVGGNDEKLIYRKRDEVVITAIRQAVSDFWISIENNVPPKPNFTEDAAFISKLYGYAEPNKVLDVRGDGTFEEKMLLHKKLGEEAKAIGEQRDAIKAELLTIIGDAEKVTGDSFTISAGIVAEAEISYTRSAYRMFKPSWRKKK
jgi:putative phage-type endonuclease